MIKKLLFSYFKPEIDTQIEAKILSFTEKAKANLESEGIKLLRELFIYVLSQAKRKVEMWDELTLLKRYCSDSVYQQKLAALNIRDIVVQILSDEALPIFEERVKGEKFVDDIVERIKRKQLNS